MIKKLSNGEGLAIFSLQYRITGIKTPVSHMYTFLTEFSSLFTRSILLEISRDLTSLLTHEDKFRNECRTCTIQEEYNGKA